MKGRGRMNGVLESISSQYFQLTHAEKQVADYVLANRRQVPHLSISELAQACGVADATVSRFCRRMGLGGFNHFKMDLMQQETVEAEGEELEKLHKVMKDAHVL